MVDLSTRCGGLDLLNPVMPASGTFGYELRQAFDLRALGAFVTKTVTPGERRGNPTPRVAEVAGGMLNSIGIPSKGVDAFLRDVVPLYRDLDVPLVVSISADTVEEFAAICRTVSVPGVAAIEANISCPNIEDDGRAFAMRPQTTTAAMRALRSASDLPIWAKLTPNTGEIAEVARAAAGEGADAVVVANTILAMSVDLKRRTPSLGRVMGGISGPAVKPIILRMAYQCARAVDIPVIGCGGIMTAEDALEYMLVGCRAVQVGTATFLQPGAMVEVIEGIRRHCEENGVAHVGEIVGAMREPAIGDGFERASA